MAEESFAVPQGVLRIQSWQTHAMLAGAELGRELAASGVRRSELVPFAGTTAYLKASPLAGRSRWRHAARRALLRTRVPRVQEYFNLCWMHNRHFQTPLPLAAGVLVRRGLPRYQFLLTLKVEAAGFEEALAAEPPTARAALLEELGRELGRMHALGFVHHDLFPRNLLVLGSDWPRRLVFLDAWAGGEAFHLRRPSYDLACFLLDGARLLDAEDQRLLLATYLAARGEQGRPVAPGFLERVGRERGRLLRRLRRDPARLRGGPPPGPWPPSEAWLRELGDTAR